MRFPPLVPDFLREFGSVHIEGPQLLHTRALHSVFELMGYTLDEHFPSAERLYQRDLSTEAYIQIAVAMPPDRIIVLNLQEFSTLVANAVIEQFPAFASFVPMRTFPVEKILELSRMIVRDPSGILQQYPVGPRQLLLATSPPPAMIFPSATDWIQLLASKFSPTTQAASQPSASTAETTNTAPPGRSENVAAPPDTPNAAAGSSSPSQMPGGAPPAAEATRADADSVDKQQITHQSDPRRATESWRHVITDAPGDFEPMEAQPTSIGAATSMAAHEHSAKSNSAHHSLHKRARLRSYANASATVQRGENELVTPLSRPCSRPRRLRRFRKHQESKQLTLTRQRGVPSRLTRRQPRRLSAASCARTASAGVSRDISSLDDTDRDCRNVHRGPG